VPGRGSRGCERPASQPPGEAGALDGLAAGYPQFHGAGRRRARGVPVGGRGGAGKFAAWKEGKLKLPSTHSPPFAPDVVPTLKTAILAQTVAALTLLAPR